MDIEVKNLEDILNELRNSDDGEYRNVFYCEGMLYLDVAPDEAVYIGDMDNTANGEYVIGFTEAIIRDFATA